MGCRPWWCCSQRRRSGAVPDRLQTIRAPPTNAHPRARGQNAQRAPSRGAHEHPAREQDRRRDSARVVRCASPILPISFPHPFPYVFYSCTMHTELCEDRPGGRSAARATPRVRPEKGREAQRRIRTAIPHRRHERARAHSTGLVHFSSCSTGTGTGTNVSAHVRLRLYGATATATSTSRRRLYIR